MNNKFELEISSISTDFGMHKHYDRVKHKIHYYITAERPNLTYININNVLNAMNCDARDVLSMNEIAIDLLKTIYINKRHPENHTIIPSTTNKLEYEIRKINEWKFISREEAIQIITKTVFIVFQYIRFNHYSPGYVPQYVIDYTRMLDKKKHELYTQCVDSLINVFNEEKSVHVFNNAYIED
jgi:hypothetical protein